MCKFFTLVWSVEVNFFDDQLINTAITSYLAVNYLGAATLATNQNLLNE